LSFLSARTFALSKPAVKIFFHFSIALSARSRERNVVMATKKTTKKKYSADRSIKVDERAWKKLKRMSIDDGTTITEIASAIILVYK
jgi:hypothetical protein